jgi:hypothetical protein
MADLALAQLGAIRIASPCPMKWEDMEGDGRVRFCGQCSLHVYNFSEMTPAAIADVIASRTGNGRRRADGTMITRDCPVGLALIRRKLRMAAYRIAAAIGLLVTASVALAKPGREIGRLRTCQPFATICEWLAPTAPPPPQGWIAGDIALPNPVTSGDENNG